MHPLVRQCVPAVLLSLSACTLAKEDVADEDRQAVPKAAAVSVDGPEAGGAGSLEAAANSRGALSLSGSPARWYAFTRGVRDGVNGVTAAILGSVSWVIHTRPTELSEGKAVWGPYPAEGLDPVTWRMTVTRIGEHHYRYVLEGRPKASNDDADFLTVLDGDGFSKSSESHGDGSFVLNLENAKQLDPVAHPDDSGTLRITHDLPPEISTRVGALPRFISADITPEGDEWVSVKSSAFEDRTGRLELSAFVDIDDAGSLPESVSVDSRFLASGAGRSDTSVSGGDVPPEFSPANAVECWGTDFSRVYYQSSFETPASEGDPEACAYDAATE